MECSHLAQDKGLWQALMNTIMTLGVLNSAHKFLISEGFSPSHWDKRQSYPSSFCRVVADCT